MMWRKSSSFCAAPVFLLSWSATTADGTVARPDQRVQRLEAFFKAYGCPQPYYIQDYLRAADAYQIDYRILPALSLRESTCGIHANANNYWGWDSGRSRFESIEAGIEYISLQLAEGVRYRDKALEDKLRTYNPYPRYVKEVKNLMRRIDPVG